MNSSRTRTVLVLAAVAMAALVFTATSASAAVVPVTGITGNHGGDEYGTGMGALINGSGMDTTADPSDPSKWVVAYNNYPDEWMANPLVGALNSKIAWASFDLGTSTALADLYLWNVRYSSGGDGTATYNLYYADSPTVALPAQPNKGSWSNTGLTPQGDYDFVNGGGWTLFNTTGVLTVPKKGDSVVDLSGVTARYVALEILTNQGSTYNGGRVGLLEVAVTTPEPATMALLGLGGLALLRRRRRA